jgi:NitT/TauT family transport system ATP-binding protein
MPASKIQFENVSKNYTRGKMIVPAVAEFNLSIYENEFVVFVGPSGCGKSTLLHMAAGLITPTSGKVLLDGKEITEPGPDRAVVFQQFALFPWKTVYENIKFGLRFKNMDEAEKKNTAEKHIAMMGLNGFENSYPHELSGGMKQRVAIARAYAVHPAVLLLDEPFAALDAQTRTIMQEELVEFGEQEKHTVLFITHSVEEAIFLGDRVVVITRRPAQIKEVIDLKDSGFMPDRREKTLDEFLSSEQFASQRTKVWGLVRSEISNERGNL